ncbi:MAG: hypothetical protein U0361_16345 [Nitrospiraceae bacterium]
MPIVTDALPVQAMPAQRFSESSGMELEDPCALSDVARRDGPMPGKRDGPAWRRASSQRFAAAAILMGFSNWIAHAGTLVG